MSKETRLNSKLEKVLQFSRNNKFYKKKFAFKNDQILQNGQIMKLMEIEELFGL